jgi:hypothetical protein
VDVVAVALFLRLPMTPTAYDRLIASLELDVSPPIGEIVHVAAETGDGIEVCEVWQTREAAEAFLHGVLTPRLHDFGVKDAVEHALFPLHNLYAPDLDTIERIGAVSLTGVSAGSVIR